MGNISPIQEIVNFALDSFNWPDIVNATLIEWSPGNVYADCGVISLDFFWECDCPAYNTSFKTKITVVFTARKDGDVVVHDLTDKQIPSPDWRFYQFMNMTVTEEVSNAVYQVLLSYL